MSPTCTPFGSWSNLNKVINYDRWHESYMQAAPHGRFCGTVAKLQIDSGRYFIIEQPAGSHLFEEPPWPYIMDTRMVFKCMMHQCMTGLRDSHGYLCMKPTMMVSNSIELLTPFLKFWCDGKHAHGTTKKEQQHWTPTMAQAIVDGIANLRTAIARGTTHQFPTSAGSSSDPGCIACKRHLVRTDPLHTRDPVH